MTPSTHQPTITTINDISLLRRAQISFLYGLFISIGCRVTGLGNCHPDSQLSGSSSSFWHFLLGGVKNSVRIITTDTSISQTGIESIQYWLLSTKYLPSHYYCAPCYSLVITYIALTDLIECRNYDYG